MPDAVQHAPHLRRVLDLDLVADPPQPDRAQRVALRPVGAVGRLHLPDLHDVAPSPSPSASDGVAAAGASASAPAVPLPLPALVSATGVSAPPSSPSTALTERPRSSATSSGLRSPCRPVIVALTRLIG